MIAIAGAKGGCGKTITTIGLAEAVGRRGTTSIAADADCQLPNLHVAGGVDRTPTLAALESDVDVESVVQPSPRTPNVGLLSAPESSNRVNFEMALERLEADTVRTFVDCPSGAGIDVVEPLSAAEGVIVVTTDSERSISAAETTIEMARRLEVPILGTVVNRCESVPQTVRSWTDVPVLGRVPDGTAPLTDEATRAAYDEIAATIATRTAMDGSAPPYDDDLLRTGYEPLDRAFGGGLEPGSMVAVVAAPASRSERFLSETTAVRGTLYLSTERSAANVQRALESVPTATGNPTVRRLSDENGLAEARSMADKLPASSTLVVDPVNALERDGRDEYVSFLDDLKEQLVETGSIGLLHCLNGHTIPSNRTVTTHAADAVFEITAVTPETGANVEHYLSVPKYRADGTTTEAIELEFGKETVAPNSNEF